MDPTVITGGQDSGGGGGRAGDARGGIPFMGGAAGNTGATAATGAPGGTGFGKGDFGGFNAFTFFGITADPVLRDRLKAEGFQSLRIAQVVLSTFSMLAAISVTVLIIRDARKARKQIVTLKPRTTSLVDSLHPAETLPLVLSVVVFVQQLVCLSIQASSLHTKAQFGCSTVAQLVWPSIFVVPYTILGFSSESVVRATRQPKFAPRGKSSSILIGATIAVATVLTWIISEVDDSHTACFSSLPWFIVDLDVPAVIILSILIVSSLFVCAVIGIQLFLTPEGDPEDRIAVSRECFFLVFAAIVLVLVLPFFALANQVNLTNHIASADVAGIAITLQGLLFAVLYMLLRANAKRLAIKPKGAPWRRQRPFRLVGNDLTSSRNSEMRLPEFQKLTSSSRSSADRLSPVSIQIPDATHSSMENRGSRTLNPFQQESVSNSPTDKYPAAGTAEKLDSATDTSPRNANKTANSAYTLWPAQSVAAPTLTAQSSVVPAPMAASLSKDVGDEPLPPRPLFAGKQKHQRMSSNPSIATVQIGLRLSMQSATVGASQSAGMRQALSPPLPPSPRSTASSPKSPRAPRRAPNPPTSASSLQQSQLSSPPAKTSPSHRRTSSGSRMHVPPKLDTAVATASRQKHVPIEIEQPVSANAIANSPSAKTPSIKSPPMLLSNLRYVPGVQKARNLSNRPAPPKPTGSESEGRPPSNKHWVDNWI